MKRRAMEVAQGGIELKVALADSPDAPPNRVVIYDWFTRVGTPPRAGNDVELLVDGEAAWSRVFQDLSTAQTTVQVATWMLRPDIELIRPEALALAEPAEREQYRFGDLIERLADKGVHVRLLIWGMTYTPIFNKWLRRWFWTAPPHIELLEQDHPKLIGSHHQKTFTIDGRVGYCGGMNVKENDWDTIEHRVYDPRRNPHDSDAEFRKAVQDGRERTKFKPRHDLNMRIEGPAVHDLMTNFQSRWNQSLRVRQSSFLSRMVDKVRVWFGNQPQTFMGPPEPDQADMGERWVQIVRTMPHGEEGILDAYKRAIANARRYIYIENQYFRSPIIGDAIARAVARNPALRLAVVAWPINDGEVSKDPSGYWTAHTQDAIRKVRPSFRLTRVMMHDPTAKEVEERFVQIDVHAKVMIIDDVWVTIGSANINDRVFKYEGEINAVVLDKEQVRDLRLRLMAEHLEVPMDQAEAELGDIDKAFNLWEAHGEANPACRKGGSAPQSRVHHFLQKAGAEPPFGVGSGVF
jgi:phosphatidylserine/phosphatidylglycerophosphate/cardiolipin synthase-like enzyme